MNTTHVFINHKRQGVCVKGVKRSSLIVRKSPKLILTSHKSNISPKLIRSHKIAWKKTKRLITVEISDRRNKKLMVYRKKMKRICDRGSAEDLISKLPDAVICEILFNLPTKDAVRTSSLSTRWRYVWQWVPGLDLDSRAFSNKKAFGSVTERFIDSHKDSWIRKLWIKVCFIAHADIPLSMYTCKTLVHLKLCRATLPNAEFVCLPCLKIIHLNCIHYPNEATLEKLISGSPVLEDLTMIGYGGLDKKAIRLCSQTVKRIRLHYLRVVIDAPLLHSLRSEFYQEKNFKIIQSGFPAKLDIDVELSSGSSICDIVVDISRVRELVINNGIWKDIFQYSKSGPILQFRDLCCLNAEIWRSNIGMLPTILESCPNLSYLILKLVGNRYPFYKRKKMRKIEPKVTFLTAPRCLVSSLKFVQYKRSCSRYEGEMELVRYFLKNSAILEKFRLDIYDREETKFAVHQKLIAIPRCSSACEVNVFFVLKEPRWRLRHNII